MIHHQAFECAPSHFIDNLNYVLHPSLPQSWPKESSSYIRVFQIATWTRHLAPHSTRRNFSYNSRIDSSKSLRCRFYFKKIKTCFKVDFDACRNSVWLEQGDKLPLGVAHYKNKLFLVICLTPQTQYAPKMTFTSIWKAPII